MEVVVFPTQSDSKGSEIFCKYQFAGLDTLTFCKHLGGIQALSIRGTFYIGTLIGTHLCMFWYFFYFPKTYTNCVRARIYVVYA